MLPIVIKDHPLVTKPELCLADLSVNRQIVIRDLGGLGKEM